MPLWLLAVFGAGAVPLWPYLWNISLFYRKEVHSSDKFTLSTTMGRLNWGYEEAGDKDNENKMTP